MTNAVWLLCALPYWYFQVVMVILNPFIAGWLSFIPALGIVCLGLGVALGLIRKQVKLLLYLIPFLACEILVFVSGLCRGMRPADGAEPLQWLFLITYCAGVIYLIYLLKGMRLAATLLTVFSITYALFASFVSVMSLKDCWL